MKKRKKGFSQPFPLALKDSSTTETSPPLTPDLAGKFSHTSAAFSLSHLLDAVVHWTIQRILGYFKEE